MTLADALLGDETLEGYLRRVLVRIDDFQRGLGAQADWVEKLKLAVFVTADPVFSKAGRPLVRNKTDESNEQFFHTDKSPDQVEVLLADGGYSRNLISTKKYRMVDDGERQQWAVGSYRIVYGEDDKYQHHVYLFPDGNGGTDVYGHKETNYEHDPSGHVEDRQWNGDPDDKATPLLEE